MQWLVAAFQWLAERGRRSTPSQPTSVTLTDSLTWDAKAAKVDNMALVWKHVSPFMHASDLDDDLTLLDHDSDLWADF